MDVRLFHVCDLSGGDFAQKKYVGYIFFIVRISGTRLLRDTSFVFGPVPSNRMLVRNPAMVLHTFVVLHLGNPAPS